LRTFEGSFCGKDLKFAIVISRFNSFITDELLKGCLDGLKRHDVDSENIDVYIMCQVLLKYLLCAKSLQSQKNTMQ